MTPCTALAPPLLADLRYIWHALFAVLISGYICGHLILDFFVAQDNPFSAKLWLLYLVFRRLRPNITATIATLRPTRMRRTSRIFCSRIGLVLLSYLVGIVRASFARNLRVQNIFFLLRRRHVATTNQAAPSFFPLFSKVGASTKPTRCSSYTIVFLRQSTFSVKCDPE